MQTQNGYPNVFIQRHSHPSQNQTLSSQAPTTTTYTTLPYIRGASEAISWILSPLGIRTTFRLTNTLRPILVYPKDLIPKQERSCAVYRILCTNCPRAYIGQTSRTLAQQIKEHQRSVRYSDIATSVLAEHSNSTGHPIQWDEVHVIDTCPHTSRRCLLESWAIHKEPNPLNRELGSLPHSYKTLIKHS